MDSESGTWTRVAGLTVTLLGTLATRAVSAHPGHGTPTPAGPLGGPVSTAVVVGLAGLAFLVGGVMLGDEDATPNEVRAGAVAVGVGFVTLAALIALGVV